MAFRFPHRLARALLAGVIWASAPALALGARESDMPAALDPLLAEATRENPRVKEAQARYQAARARALGQGLRPDPMVEAGVMNLWGLMGPQLTVSQTFPLGGKLDRDRQLAEAEVALAYQEYRAALNGLLAEVRQSYFDLYFYQQAAAIVERNKQVLTQMSKIANARYALGQGKQSDVLRTQTQLAEMLHEAVVVRQQRESASVKLMGLLNRRLEVGHIHPTEQAIPTPVTAPLKRKPAELVAAAEAGNPEVLRARSAIAQAEAALASSRTIGTPDLTTRLGVARSYMDMGWQTVVTGMVGANLPLSSRQREAAAVAGGEAELAARRAALEDTRREVVTGLQQALTHVRHLEEQVRLFDRGVLPQARQALQSELSNYQVGRSDFDAVLAAQMNLYRYERDYQQAIADYQKMLAEIAALTGEGLPEAQETP